MSKSVGNSVVIPTVITSASGVGQSSAAGAELADSEPTNIRSSQSQTPDEDRSRSGSSSHNAHQHQASTNNHHHHHHTTTTTLLREVRPLKSAIRQPSPRQGEHSSSYQQQQHSLPNHRSAPSLSVNLKDIGVLIQLQ